MLGLWRDVQLPHLTPNSILFDVWATWLIRFLPCKYHSIGTTDCVFVILRFSPYQTVRWFSITQRNFFNKSSYLCQKIWSIKSFLHLMFSQSMSSSTLASWGNWQTGDWTSCVCEFGSHGSPQIFTLLPLPIRHLLPISFICLTRFILFQAYDPLARSFRLSIFPSGKKRCWNTL